MYPSIFLLGFSDDIGVDVFDISIANCRAEDVSERTMGVHRLRKAILFPCKVVVKEEL